MKDNFLTDIIEGDLSTGRHDHVVTRFPPEPNGYLHIGHAKSICLNAGLARRFGGNFHLRFDDTNPVKEDTEYVESIQHDVAWLLGGDLEAPPWQALFFASDYFDKMYMHAVELVQKGLAYVDDQDVEAIRNHRGDFERPGINSPHRDRTIEENLALFQQMRDGVFPDGHCVLRAKIDMAHPNMLLRDPILYRIKHASHHRTGAQWCIYPMYDFAHCLEDAIEGITHSVCTLEFESNRALYDWVLDNAGAWRPRPRQYEFARLGLGYTVMSKRKLLELVEGGHVDGWDDPRMATISGLRARGVTADAIQAFVEMVGVAKNNSLVDIGKLEHCIRSDLEDRTPRAMGVLRPLKLVITNWPTGAVIDVSAPWWPQHNDRAESRTLPLTENIWIEQDDFCEEPPAGFKRLAPGREVRLRHGCVVRCEDVIKDDNGTITELRCTHDPETIGGKNPVGRKVQGTIHWVSADKGVPVTVRLYDRLFVTERPDGDAETDFKTHLNPRSLVTLQDAFVEPALATVAEGTRWQFERVGYFVRRGSDDAPAFWRTITLRDTWATRSGQREVSGRPDRGAKLTEKTHRERDYAGERAAGEPRLHAFFESLVAAGIGAEDAFAVSASPTVMHLFETAATTAHDDQLTAKWLANVVPGVLTVDNKTWGDVDGAAFGRLVQLVSSGAITATAAKDVLAEMLATGREPAAIVEEKGLLMADRDAVHNAVATVMSRHPAEAARYQAGERKLVGFFMGQVMRQMRGKGDPQAVREALLERCSS